MNKNLICVFILVIISLFIISGCNDIDNIVGKKPVQILTEPSCIDSDDGIKYYTNGQIIEINQYTNWNSNIFSDMCINDSTLFEAICELRPDNYYYGSQIQFDCPYGCENGECIIPEDYTPTECQTDFKVAYIYVYEHENHSVENFNRLVNSKSLHQEILNIASDGKITFDLSYPIVVIEINDSNRERLFQIGQPPGWKVLDSGEVMKEFYTFNPDEFDFVNVFTNFDLSPEWGGPGGSHLPIRNKIIGIGIDLFDLSNTLGGSSNKLLGYNFIKNINWIYNQEHLQTMTEQQINCLFIVSPGTHEITHQWSAYIGEPYNSNWENELILQSSYGGGGHWFQGLDLNYDPVGGMKWQENNNGTYTTLDYDQLCAERNNTIPYLLYGIQKFSNLTFYLLGALESSEISPFLFVNYTEYTDIITTVVAESKYIEIEEIIKEEGERICLDKLEQVNTKYLEN